MLYICHEDKYLKSDIANIMKKSKIDIHSGVKIFR